MTYNLSFF